MTFFKTLLDSLNTAKVRARFHVQQDALALHERITRHIKAIAELANCPRLSLKDQCTLDELKVERDADRERLENILKVWNGDVTIPKHLEEKRKIAIRYAESLAKSVESAS